MGLTVCFILHGKKCYLFQVSLVDVVDDANRDGVGDTVCSTVSNCQHSGARLSFFSTTILFSLQYSVSLWSTSVERADDVCASCILYVSGRTALPSGCVVNAICDDWQVKRGNRSALIS